MPARDIFHDAVRSALEKEEWLITADPLRVSFGDVNVYIDLAADKLIAADKGERKIAIEIKSFVSPSELSDFYLALGQFISYRTALAHVEPHRDLYLAVPFDTYRRFFFLEFTSTIVEAQNMRLVIYDAEKQEIVLWKE